MGTAYNKALKQISLPASEISIEYRWTHLTSHIEPIMRIARVTSAKSGRPS
jgi:hypothetical protein